MIRGDIGVVQEEQGDISIVNFPYFTVNQSLFFTFSLKFIDILIFHGSIMPGMIFAFRWLKKFRMLESLKMAKWWKCKIVPPSMMPPFSKREIIYATNGDDFITLFDGQ